MFEIVAKDQPVLIERLDINMGAGTETVEVYYRLGHVDNQYDDSYKLIFRGDITGTGKGLVTSLPSFTSPVLVTPGTPVTFYVTIANVYGTNMWYSVGVGSGTTYASDPNIDIIEGYASPYPGSDVIEGYASGYPWTGYTLDRQWNGKSKGRNVTASISFHPEYELKLMSSVIFLSTGVVHYSFQTTSSPTASPTKRLTASPVTFPPSVGNPNPTASPATIIEVDDKLVEVTETPTRAPTDKPTTTETADLESPTKCPTKSPTPILLRSAPTLSTTVEVEEDDTIWFTDLLPVFDS